MNADYDGGAPLEQAEATRKPTTERKREIDDAVAYAIGHRIRIEALAILAEGRHSPSEIAKLLGEDVRLVGNHIRELYDCGCIEAAGTRKVRNATEHFYRAVTLPYISDEEYRAMSTESRREVISVIVQAVMAEVLASFRAKKLERDDDVWLAWDCANLDDKGKREVADELAESFERLSEIKARSAGRLAESREKAAEDDEEAPEGTTTVISLMGFERSRAKRPASGYPPRDEP